jgi:beta-lactamase regulating signal transducer with metallopeptidase domain
MYVYCVYPKQLPNYAENSRNERRYNRLFMYGLWCLTPLSTIFQYIATVSFINGGNRSNRRNHRPVASHRQTLSHNIVSITPRHERVSNSEL